MLWMSRTSVWLALAAHVASAQTTPFAKLMDRLSEPGGFFPGDNLVSNETSYLHVIPTLHAIGVSGGAFIGVGPEQNFSYIAEIHPRVALIVDIRRDNLLLHLLYKAAFEEARGRLEYLCLLYSRPIPADAATYRTKDLAQVIAYLDRTREDATFHARVRSQLIARIERDGVTLPDQDKATIARFHDEIGAGGLDLKFELPPGRVPSRDYPVVRRLYVERDLNGRQVSYVATEERWAAVKALEDSGNVIPVVGNFAGTKAIRAIGNYLREINTPVSAFYVSNVEFYLRPAPMMEAYVANVQALPTTSRTVIIRSWFEQGGSRIASLQPGHFSAQLLETFPGFERATKTVSNTTYYDMIADSIPMRHQEEP